MTHKLILKVKMFQLCSAKRFGTAGGKPPGGCNPPPPQIPLTHLGLMVGYRKNTKTQRN